MTIDLGFAWLTLPSGERVGIVDVPGHKDFIKNMLAGVGGIDAALFVVAADEGVMPQTREHLAILDLLQVRRRRGRPDQAGRGPGLRLARPGRGRPARRAGRHGAPGSAGRALFGPHRAGTRPLGCRAGPLLASGAPRRDVGRPRLPVDRIFTIAGFGTVVTGTLSDGSLVAGQEVEMQPSGLKARIRGLQTHKLKVGAGSSRQPCGHQPQRCEQGRGAPRRRGDNARLAQADRSWWIAICGTCRMHPCP